MAILKSIKALFGIPEEIDTPTRSSEFIGNWVLRSVGDQPPPIALHVIRVKEGEVWESKSLLLYSGGAYTEVSGGGEWRVRDGSLAYTAGDNSGQLSIRLQADKMTLAKDPMLQLSEYPDTQCVYERVSDDEIQRLQAWLIEANC